MYKSCIGTTVSLLPAPILLRPPQWDCLSQHFCCFWPGLMQFHHWGVFMGVSLGGHDWSPMAASLSHWLLYLSLCSFPRRGGVVVELGAQPSKPTCLGLSGKRPPSWTHLTKDTHHSWFQGLKELCSRNPDKGPIYISSATSRSIAKVLQWISFMIPVVFPLAHSLLPVIGCLWLNKVVASLSFSGGTVLDSASGR